MRGTLITETICFTADQEVAPGTDVTNHPDIQEAGLAQVDTGEDDLILAVQCQAEGVILEPAITQNPQDVWVYLV